MTSNSVFLLAPLSRIGTALASNFIENYDNVVAVIDDTSSLDIIFGKPRWTSNQLLEKIKQYPQAIAIDFSVRQTSHIWAAELCRKADIKKLNFSSAWNALNLPAYASIKPIASYSPWLKDIEFLSIFQKIASSTLVDHLRLWELWTLVDATSHIPGSILEIGVWRGGTGALMAHKLQQGGGGNIYLCDTFTGVVKAGEFDSWYTGGEHADTSREHVEALLKELAPAVKIRILEGIFPDTTGMEVQDETFRLVHIDVDTYQSAQDIFNFIWPKIPPGGIIVYDDYGFACCSGITKHVDELRNRKDIVVIHNINGHALLIKR